MWGFASGCKCGMEEGSSKWRGMHGRGLSVWVDSSCMILAPEGCGMHGGQEWPGLGEDRAGAGRGP